MSVEHDVRRPSPEAELDAFVEEYSPDVAGLIRAARARIRGLVPSAVELLYDNYNSLVIGYGPSAEASEAILSLMADTKGVSLCFLQYRGLPDPNGLLESSGAFVPNIRLDTEATLDRPDVRELVVATLERARKRIDPAGEHRLVIRSVSARRRPRRPVPAGADGD